MGLSIAKEEDLNEITDNSQSTEGLADCEHQLKQHRIRSENMRYFQRIKMMQRFSMLEAYQQDERAEEMRRKTDQMQHYYRMFKNSFHIEKKALVATRTNITLGHPLETIPDIERVVESLNAFSESLFFDQTDGSKKIERLRNFVSRLVDDVKTVVHHVQSRIQRYQQYQRSGTENQLDQFDISEFQDCLEQLLEKLDEHMTELRVLRPTRFADFLSLQSEQLANARRRVNEHGFHLQCETDSQMSVEFEEHLRATLEDQRVAKEARGVENMRKRIREYEEKVKKANEEFAKTQEGKKSKDLEAIQKKTNDALKKIEAMKLTDQKNYDSKVSEILKESEEEKAKIKKQYEQIIVHHSKELEKDRLEIEKDLLGTDNSRFNVHQEFNNTHIKMQEETQDKLERKADEQRKRMEARHSEQLTELSNNVESTLESERSLAQKIEEDGDKKIEMHRDLGNKNLQMQIDLFHLQVHRNNEANEKKLNSFISKSQDSFKDVVEIYQACQQYIADGLTEKQMEKGKKCFADLNRELRSLDGKFLDIQMKLTDVEKNEETKDKVKKMREMKMIIFKLSSCAALLSAQLRVGNTQRNETKEKEFVTLMTGLVTKMNQLGQFEKCNSQVKNHIQKSIPHVEKEESSSKSDK